LQKIFKNEKIKKLNLFETCFAISIVYLEAHANNFINCAGGVPLRYTTIKCFDVDQFP
jgi:hypothetical protein